MTVSALALAAASIAGVVVAAIAMHGLRSRSRTVALAAAAVRGLAAALAVIAAFGPVARSSSRVSGATFLAAPDDASTQSADATLRWPTDAPDAAAALETLRAMRDAGAPASLVLVAGDDVGRARDLAPATQALRAGADVERAVIARPSPDTPRPLRPAPRILVPAGITEGVPFKLTLDAGDAPFESGTARVEIDLRPRTEPSVSEFPLEARSSRATTDAMTLAASGRYVVVAEVPGRLPAATILDVAGPPRVIVVSADEGTSAFVSMLRAQGVDVADLRADSVSRDDVARCAAIVLGPGAAPAADVGAAITERVRGGAGLLVLGGEKRAGLCRFDGHPLASLLPVVPPPPPAPPPEDPVPPPPEKKPDPAKPKPALDEGEKEALRVALLLVIDTSGSMGGQKLVMAQQAAIAAAGALAPEDRVSVISFSDLSREVAPFQNAVDLAGLYRRIAALRAEGMTNYFPALKLGYRKILDERCGIRHIVLLTDGATLPAVFQELIEGGASNGVTLSTVAIGDDAVDSELFNQAKWGRGKKYNATDPSRLPEIITLDTRRFATEPRDLKRKGRPAPAPDDLPQPPSDTPPVPREGASEPKRDDVPVTLSPHISSAASLLAGLESARWPHLPFPKSPAAKPASQIVLAWDDGTAALTLGRAGLGRVGVFAAGIASPEAGEFARWAEAPQFVAQLVRGLVEPSTGETAPVDVTLVETDDGRAFARVPVGGGGRLELTSIRGTGTVTATCADRGGSSLAELRGMPPGGVLAGTFAPAGGAPRRALAVSPGPRPLLADAAKRVARAAGAPIVDEIPPPGDGAPEDHEEPAGLAFVAAAAGLLVVEAALRRLARTAA